MNTNKIPKNYTEYSVRTYRNMVDESGEYGTTDIIHGTDYANARKIFLDNIKNTDYYCVELIVNTADEDDDSKEIIVEQRKNMNTNNNTFDYTIHKQVITLTKLIAETVELDTEKYCLTVELDFLIKHLQNYKQTCEECVATATPPKERLFLCEQCDTPTDHEGPVGRLCIDCEKCWRCEYGDCECAECELKRK